MSQYDESDTAQRIIKGIKKAEVTQRKNAAWVRAAEILLHITIVLVLLRFLQCLYTASAS